MSVYKNPPLVYVKSRLWWHISDQQDFEKSKLIAGMVYPFIKNDLPIILDTNNESISGVSYADEKQQLIAQVSNSDFSIISTDENYSWQSYSKQINKWNSKVLNSINEVLKPHHIHSQLEYCDFFKIGDTDSLSFLQEKLKLNIQNNLILEPDTVSFSLTKRFEEEGIMSMKYYDNVTNLGDNGLIVKFTFDSFKIDSDLGVISKWYESAHNICSQLFKDLIKGKLEKVII